MGEASFFVVPAQLEVAVVKDVFAKGEASSRWCIHYFGSPEEDLDFEDQFFNTKRLGDIIVGTCFVVMESLIEYG